MGRIKGALRGGMEEMEVEVSSLSLRSDTFLPDASSPSIVAGQKPSQTTMLSTDADFVRVYPLRLQKTTTSTEARKEEKKAMKKIFELQDSSCPECLVTALTTSQNFC